MKVRIEYTIHLAEESLEAYERQFGCRPDRDGIKQYLQDEGVLGLEELVAHYHLGDPGELAMYGKNGRKSVKKSVKERRKEREKLEARGFKFVMQPLEEQQHLNSLSDEEYFDWFEQEEQEIQQTIKEVTL